MWFSTWYQAMLFTPFSLYAVLRNNDIGGFDCFVIAIQRGCFSVVSQVALESCIDNRYRTCNKWCTKAHLLPRSACWTTSFRGLGGFAPPQGWHSWQNKLGTSLLQIVLTFHLTQCSCFSVMICRNRNRRSATLQSHRRSCKALFIHCSSHKHT